MGLFSTLFVGVAPFGALLSGLLAQRIGVAATLTGTASVVLVASLAFHWRLPALRRAIAVARPDLAGDQLP